MTNYIDIEQLPAVKNVMKLACTEIFQITGVKVVFSMRRVKSETMEENKEVLRELIVKEFDQPWNKIISKSRKNKLVNARFVYMYFARNFLGQSLKQIGMDLGNRDHTTVLNGLQVLQDLSDVKDPIINNINEIKLMLPYDI